VIGSEREAEERSDGGQPPRDGRRRQPARDPTWPSRAELGHVLRERARVDAFERRAAPAQPGLELREIASVGTPGRLGEGRAPKEAVDLGTRIHPDAFAPSGRSPAVDGFGCDNPAVSGPARSAVLHLKTARRLLRRRPLRIGSARAPLDDRVVFVFGSPRSGTTFLAGAIGSLPGFVDLTEVAALKARIPELARMPTDEAAAGIRRMLTVTRTLGLVRDLRAVEQTPETAFLLPAVAAAFPEAVLVHAVRDGRDVVCSLLERGWLASGRAGGADDAFLPYGAAARFWVEPGREAEFAAASETSRAAWAWCRYVTAVLQSGAVVHEVRYERMASDPEGTASELAGALGAPTKSLAEALAKAHASSVGRYRHDLTPEQLGEVEAEAGTLLRALGY
jgi:Sulfotransferase family